MKNFFSNYLKSAYFLLVCGFLLIVVVQFIPQSEKISSQARIRNAEKKLISFRDEMMVRLDEISALTTEKEHNDYFLQLGKIKSGFSFYQLDSGVVSHWSDNEPAISDSMLMKITDGEFLRLPNGDFLAYTRNPPGRKIIGLILVKHSYEYENKYLVNSFNPALQIGDDFRISNVGDTLFLPGNKPAYILSHDPYARISTPGIIVTFYLISCFVLLLSFYFFLKHFSGSFISSFLSIVAVCGIRTLMIYFKFPSDLYNHGIFSPVNYASSFYFNSLGDMFLNASLLLVLTISLYENVFVLRKYKAVLLIIWIVSALLIHFLIRGLVINSNISFELNAPAPINLYGFLAFASISILLISFLFLSAGLLKATTGYRIAGRHAWAGILICALYSAIAIKEMNREKEGNMRKLIAQKAEMRQDHVAEYLFHEQEENIISDTELYDIINSGIKVNERLSSAISQKYFQGYLSKFDISVQLFENSNAKDPENSLEFFRREAELGSPTSSRRLFFLNNEIGTTTYLSILPLGNDTHTMVLLMSARFLRSTKGFPELFISGRYEENYPSDDYSLARYSGQSLVYEYGKYIYPLTAKDFKLSTEKFSWQNFNGYSHLINRINANSFIIVSKPEGNIFNALTLFSWMFTFISILTFIVFLISIILGTGEKWEWNLTRRVQVSVIFLVVLAFVLVGAGTVFYITDKYSNDQRKSISDQVNALWFMVSKDLPAVTGMEEDTASSFIQLDRLVSNTNIDFNIYSGEGKMIYSSQPKIFDKGIISERMHPAAYRTIKDQGLTQYIHPENAGLLNYIAAYAPFTDRSGNIVAFLNLPYFEKQNELNREVSIFLSSLVNIYVLLFALAVLVTIFISSRITKPLLLIRENMSRIRLGEANEKIAYKEKDEIGYLVHEYNRMIDELSVSADMLARSERETAWREMARQVAHEIKNPLTPMKLSVQHLQRTFDEKGNNAKAQVDRIATTLIQQIDTLSNIATAFSNFAKMPQPDPQKVELKDLIQQVASLYSESIHINFHFDDGNYFVVADKDRLISVFSNLFKNSIQAIPADSQGEVNVNIRRGQGYIEVEIRDNGIGIPESQRDKIFTPNFTTKSSGMGLGLAYVRNVVEEASGNVWFTTSYGEGTSFFVRLPEQA